MLTASILGFAVLEVDKLFANTICENGEIRHIFYKNLATNNNLLTSRTAERHSMLAVNKLLAASTPIIVNKPILSRLVNQY